MNIVSKFLAGAFVTAVTAIGAYTAADAVLDDGVDSLKRDSVGISYQPSGLNR